MKTRELIAIGMVCITLLFITLFVCDCNEKVETFDVIEYERQTQWYTDNGYVREWSNWHGYHWTKPEKK